MRRRVYIFYISNFNGDDRQRVELPCGSYCFIRVERALTTSQADALDEANSRADEVVMNTHALFGAE